MPVLLLPLLLLFGSPSFAQDLGKIYSPTIRGNVLTIEGQIDSHIYDYLSLETKALKAVDTVVLNSFGGNSEWALEVAARIRASGWNTSLPAGNVCASACVVLFAAGKERLAAKGTWLGIHGARFGAGVVTKFQGLCFLELEDGPVFLPGKKGCQEFLDGWYARAMAMTSRMFGFMEQGGVSGSLRSTYFAMADDPEWYKANNVLRKPDWVLPAEEALPFQLVTSLIAD